MGFHLMIHFSTKMSMALILKIQKVKFRNAFKKTWLFVLSLLFEFFLLTFSLNFVPYNNNWKIKILDNSRFKAKEINECQS